MEEKKDMWIDGDMPSAFICFNKDCIFYGIERINKEWFDY